MAGKVICDYINNDNVAGGFLGIGQTWQVMTGSRAAGVNYTNSTGKPIQVSIDANTPGLVEFFVDGTLVTALSSGAAYYRQTFAIVPNGSIYRLASGVSEITRWTELR